MTAPDYTSQCRAVTFTSDGRWNCDGAAAAAAAAVRRQHRIKVCRVVLILVALLGVAVLVSIDTGATVAAIVSGVKDAVDGTAKVRLRFR